MLQVRSNSLGMFDTHVVDIGIEGPDLLPW